MAIECGEDRGAQKPARGLVLAYFSYPLNWLYLTYVFLPLARSWAGSVLGWLGPGLATDYAIVVGPAAFLLSPMTLPFELFLTVGLLACAALMAIAPKG